MRFFLLAAAAAAIKLSGQEPEYAMPADDELVEVDADAERFGRMRKMAAKAKGLARAAGVDPDKLIDAAKDKALGIAADKLGISKDEVVGCLQDIQKEPEFQAAFGACKADIKSPACIQSLMASKDEAMAMMAKCKK